MDFTSMENERRAHGENNDCAVKAIALATGCAYIEALTMLAEKGRKTGRGTYFHKQTVPVMQELGFALERYYPRSATVRTLTKELKEGTWLVRTSGHILCIKDGECLDWTNGRLHRIVDVHRVVDVRNLSIRDRVWRAADEAWAATPSPYRNKQEALAMRKRVMAKLEQQGIKRSTASMVLCEWQKANVK